jgi:MFS family permease
VLAVRDARSLIIASAASQFGNWLFNAALLAYVYEATHSAGWVGAATICRLLPYVLLGPVGGTIADRYDRRTVLVVGDVLRFVIMRRDRPHCRGLGGRDCGAARRARAVATSGR